MDLLNLKEHTPEDYPGKIIKINLQDYIIGHLVGEGANKLVYQLINTRSGLCHYVLQVPLDQGLAAGVTKYKNLDPYNGMHCYDYYRWIAKTTYRYDGYNEKGALPIFADFLDIEDFATLNNKYHGIFKVVEFFNDDGDDSTGGIYQQDLASSLILLKINLQKDSNDIQELKYVCNLCQTYLTETNENDDNIIETYILTKMRIFDVKDRIERNKIVELTTKMLEIEPYFKRHIYTAASVYFHLEMWKKVISLFEYIKDVIYEPYSVEWFMVGVVYAYRMINKIEKANEYLKYIRPDIREKLIED